MSDGLRECRWEGAKEICVLHFSFGFICGRFPLSGPVHDDSRRRHRGRTLMEVEVEKRKNRVAPLSSFFFFLHLSNIQYAR